MLKTRYENIVIEDIDLRKKDYLDNLIYAENLKQKILEYFESDDSKPLYIALTGSWGSGKTTVAYTAYKVKSMLIPLPPLEEQKKLYQK